MTDRITELAKQAGFPIDDAPITQPYVIQAPHYKVDDELKRFYALARNDALEEAAKVCDENGDCCNEGSVMHQLLTGNAAAIRSMKT